MEVVTTRVEEEYEKSFKTNLFIAVFTTAHARLNLYEAPRNFEGTSVVL